MKFKQKISELKIKTLEPGERAPDFSLVEGGSGQPVSLSDFAGKQAVVLIFFRGMW